MDTWHRHCAGLDVHKDSVWVCVRHLSADDQAREELRSFGTTTADLLALLDWLLVCGVTIVAMESTGVYWKPVYNVLEGHVRVLLVNAEHIKQVEGRKTDAGDCAWIAQLLQHGLLRPSFVPDRPIRDLRDLTRQRVQLTQERAAAVNRVQKVLEDANIKLGSVASDVLGVSGRAMLEALSAGETDPARLAERARGRLRLKIPQLVRALTGRVTEHHRFLLRLHLDHLSHLDALVDRLTGRIGELLAPPAAPDPGPGGPGAADADPAAPRSTDAAGPAEPTQAPAPAEQTRAPAPELARGPGPAAAVEGLGEAAARLTTIPGVSRRTAEVILAEIGADMGQFPTAGHLASWAGLCPGNHQSAGKRFSGQVRRGNRWLKRALVQAAWAASRRRKGALAGEYRRLSRRRGAKRALLAVAHTLLVTCYHLLKKGTTYQEPPGSQGPKGGQSSPEAAA